MIGIRIAPADYVCIALPFLVCNAFCKLQGIEGDRQEGDWRYDAPVGHKVELLLPWETICTKLCVVSFLEKKREVSM